jgi:hypothetical protein
MCYDLSGDKSNIDRFYSSSNVTPMPKVPLARRPDMHTWTNKDFPGVQEIWARRPTIETAIKRVMFGSLDSFNTNFNRLEDALRTAGWTSAYFNGAYTQKFLELNEDYLPGFYRG